MYDKRNIKRYTELLQPNLSNTITISSKNGESLIVDKSNDNIIYNITYATANEKCIGAHFSVINTFRTKRSKKTGKTSLMIRIQFIESLTSINIPYGKFISRNVFDPYYLNMFGHMCCLGNIDINEETEDAFNIWIEIMVRCFDRSNPKYMAFGRYGILPGYYCWNCFEYFYDYYAECKRKGFTISDPNDPALYYYHEQFTREELISMTYLPYSNKIPIKPLSMAMKQLTMDARIQEQNIPKQKLGRPKGTKNKPKELVNMYRIIAPENYND